MGNKISDNKRSNNSIACFNDTIKGTIFFENEKNKVKITIKLSGFPTTIEPTLHGFHIHTYGNLTKDCANNPHFNPENCNHGGQDSPIRHVGDLGNITVRPDGTVDEIKYDSYISLDLKNKYNIIGRSVFIHEGKDDCGKGTGDKKESSLKNGNSGKKIASAVIGIF